MEQGLQDLWNKYNALTDEIEGLEERRNAIVGRIASMQIQYIGALRHDLDTTEGLWAVDHEPLNEPDAFRIEHASLK